MTNLSDSNTTHITHCPRCTSAGLSWPSPKNFQCPACGFTLFLNVAAAVAVIIEHRGNILFGVRKFDPGRGLLDLPGGFADPAESAEECARREVREETGLRLTELSYLTSFPNRYLYRQITYDTMDIVFTAAADDLSDLKAGDDLADLVWLAPSSIDLERIAFPSLREAVGLYLSKGGGSRSGHCIQ